MNRITPEMVLEALKSMGIKPERQTWASEVDGAKCGCGLTAVYSAKIQGGFESLGRCRFSEVDVIVQDLRLTRNYVWGFIFGFDGYVPNSSEMSTEGYEDGKAAWEAVKHLAEVVTPITPIKE